MEVRRFEKIADSIGEINNSKVNNLSLIANNSTDTMETASAWDKVKAVAQLQLEVVIMLNEAVDLLARMLLTLRMVSRRLKN